MRELTPNEEAIAEKLAEPLKKYAICSLAPACSISSELPSVC